MLWSDRGNGHLTINEHVKKVILYCSTIKTQSSLSHKHNKTVSIDLSRRDMCM